MDARDSEEEVATNVNPEDRRAEYEAITAHHIYFGGNRFSFLASFGAFFVLLIGGYSYVWSAPEDLFKEFRRWLLIAIPVIGLLVTIAGWLIEKRNIFLARTCIACGVLLERRMGITRDATNPEEGVYKLFSSLESGIHFLQIPARHTVAIGMLYTISFFIWLFLMGYGFYSLALK